MNLAAENPSRPARPEPADESQSSQEFARATLNILDDISAEKESMARSQRAILNILDDFNDEKNKVQRGNEALKREMAERKAVEEQIVQLNAELQQHASKTEAANKELEAFSYSISHDLRAPLRHIDGFVSLLQKNAQTQLDEAGRRHLAVIAGASRKMGALIDDLLSFSRMSCAELRQGPVATETMVREIIGDLKDAAGERAVEWETAPLPEVQADATLLRQVWVNLLANAVKYSRDRQPARIAVGTQPGANGEVVFFVRNNGAGFDMQYAHKLFGVFQRLHSDQEFEGTGIGLANVRRIIARHGGHTWAEGKVGEGATFYFTLEREAGGKS